MYPTLVKIGIFEFHSYVVLMAFAFLLCVYLFFRENDRREHPFPVTPIGALWLFLGILVGSKVYYVLEYGSPADLLRVWRIWEGGLVFYGGLIGGIAVSIAYLLYYRIAIAPIGDMVIKYAPLGHAIGRFGCFLNGCCWGLPSNLPWAIRFPENSPPYRQHLHDGLLTSAAETSLPVHPTQLYAVAGLLLIYAVLVFVYRRKPFHGAIIFLYMALYGIERFTVESFRYYETRPFHGHTNSQAVAVLLILVGVAGLTAGYLWRKAPGRPETAEEPAPGQAEKTE